MVNRLLWCFECSHPVVFYYLNNHKIPVKTQHVISIMFYSDVFRLEEVIIRLLLKPYLRCTKYIWDPKCAQLLCTS